MKNFRTMTRAVSISTLLAFAAMPIAANAAGQADQARAAIAEARGKIDASDKTSSGPEAAALQLRAREALVSAQASLNNGKKETAIADARHASELADLAIAAAEKNKVGAVQDARMDASITAAAAQQSVAAADARATAAENAAAIAPAPVTTVMTTTEKEIVQAPVAAKTTVRQTKSKAARQTTAKPAAVASEKTTTIVTTTPQ